MEAQGEPDEAVEAGRGDKEGLPFQSGVDTMIDDALALPGTLDLEVDGMLLLLLAALGVERVLPDNEPAEDGMVLWD